MNKPSDGRVSIKQLIDFMQSSANKLRDSGEDDAAFYFEQVADYLQKNPYKGLDESVSKVLGL